VSLTHDLIDYKLTDEESEQIQKGMHHAPKAEVRQPATAIYLLHSGQSPEEVSQISAVSLGSIYNWHKRWRTKGLQGLENKAKSGCLPNVDHVDSRRRQS